MIRILTADDNAALRSLIRALVEAYPATITHEAENGLDAARAAERERTDPVILDISMPIINGLVAAQHIRALYRDVPILMLTAHTEPIYLQEAFRCGANGYVFKSRVTTDLHAAIRAVLGGGSYRS